ncbi:MULTISPECIES: OmpA family protein [Pantoea]|jgi:outer membrane protein OmpA-like peptidoglycan-associated protein|uniref:OmpA family protein n=1 Tax=Pantoea leporis TaxID=2933780 RepID=A0ABV2DY24_9GAMM|nr:MULTISPECIES: OmpA family protein [Pantoea]MBD9644609.1 OmpA family protein [Pantoea sp. PNT02]MBY4840340.1 OmpA family protein [Pantoea sp. DY-5]MDR6352989.1 outer membrane protein OmpA-like peptidoglycan-associated protein [Pantoea sp. SORGH_AS_0659]WFL69608.1 OmpA family protein [Pantoea sp. X85]
MKMKIFLMVCVLALVGCQAKGRFSDEQIAAMRNAGFSQNSEGWGLGLSDKILFGVNESELTPASKNTIQTMAKNLATTGIKHVRIDGHTDNYGKADYNQQLSLKRANAVATQWAQGAGIPRENIVTRGLGMSAPIASNNNPQGRAQNRRVAIVITAP